MADILTVRVYNVRFGDAILVTVPDTDPRTGETRKRRILIDVGNAPKVAGTGEGGQDEGIFEPVIADILKELGGDVLDMYVMTHEHLDHVQGLFYASAKLTHLRLSEKLKVDRVWMTGSADPDYYENHDDAKKQKLAYTTMYSRIAYLIQSNQWFASHGLMEMAVNNDPNSTGQCVEFIRKLNPKRTTYVYRGMNMRGTHPFKEAMLSVWAPEEDTSVYYGRFQSLDDGAVPSPLVKSDSSATTSAIANVSPPPGVDVGAFLRLMEARRSGVADNLLAIDKAANNTSIVFAIEWRGWRLLFSGDAEIRSWKTMAKEKMLKPVHFLKVAHHGSHNGTPTDDIFEAILPETPSDDKARYAAISTWTDTYSGIPHSLTNSRLATRAKVKSTVDKPNSLYIDFTFEG